MTHQSCPPGASGSSFTPLLGAVIPLGCPGRACSQEGRLALGQSLEVATRNLSQEGKGREGGR